MNKKFEYICYKNLTLYLGTHSFDHIITHASIIIQKNKIIWFGKTNDLPASYLKHSKIFDLEGRLLTPGLIDCHTHFIFSGNRANELALRLAGKTYQEIASLGGGILSTVKATRSATHANLYLQSEKRLKQALSHGTTTLEIKSGYGLDIETEIKCLNVAKDLERNYPVTIKTTYLGAHALPPEFNNKDKYIEFICEHVIPEISKLNLADAIDGFCESIAFTTHQIEKIFQCAKTYGMAIKLHAEQLSNQYGAQLAARYQALSVDHLEYIDEKGVAAIAESGTIAVLLPGAYYYLQEKQKPPINLFRKYNIPIAIATDCNPGTSPTTNLTLMLSMAINFWQLTPEEAMQAITFNAAKALGLEKTIGSIEINKQADFAVFNCEHPNDLCYQFGNNLCYKIIKNGVSYETKSF